MIDELGTRTRQLFRKERIDQGSDTRTRNSDKGMTKRVVTSATFTASDGKVTGSNGDFTSFVAGDPVLIQATNLNNGYHTITAIDAANHAFLVLDPAPKNEGPVANTLIRTP
jgi:hypothetical protein